MPTRGSAKQAPAPPPRRPLWRRLNRHVVFVLHVLLYIVGGTWIWTLNAPSLDKQFDVLLWLTLLSAHGLFVYHRRRLAFALHLLMFSAGNAAIWATTAPVADKLSVTLAWVLVVGGLGLWLARRYLVARAAQTVPPPSKPRRRKATSPVEEWFEPPEETHTALDPQDDTPVKKGRKKGKA